MEQTDVDMKTEAKAEPIPEPDETTPNPVEDEVDKDTAPKPETKDSENGQCVEHADVEIEPEVISDTTDSSTPSDPLLTDPEEEISNESKKVENEKANDKSPEVVNLSDDDDVEEDGDDDNDDDDEEEDEVGNPDRPPGEDAVRDIEPDHLLPFHHGWRREVIMRKGNGQVTTIIYIYEHSP
jgi:hypothetical protein